MKLSADQLRNAAWATLFHADEGRLQVTPVVNARRMSVSDSGCALIDVGFGPHGFQ
jgi:hypothetical protein